LLDRPVPQVDMPQDLYKDIGNRLARRQTESQKRHAPTESLVRVGKHTGALSGTSRDLIILNDYGIG
jgi:hypothetical protein